MLTICHFNNLMKKKMRKRNVLRCCICGKEQDGIGYNTYGYYNEHRDDRCCRKCNWKHILPILKMEKVYCEKFN